MSSELALYSCDAVPMTVSKIPRTQNYMVSIPGCVPTQLTRGVDFGMIRTPNGKTIGKNPSLFKSGAEKVAVAYGLCQNYVLESKIEDPENGFFFYTVRCDLVKIVHGERYVITSSYGSGNTREKRSGSQSPYDGANSALKMAQKRALVGAALSLGCLSDAFTQDIESDVSDEASVYFGSKNPSDPITSSQVTFFYAAASRQGLTKSDAKAFLKSNGYDSAKAITAGAFDQLLEDLKTFVPVEVSD